MFAVLFTCEDDRVETRLSPELHEMDHVPEPEGRVSSEDHARLPEVVAEVSVDAGVVPQLVGLNELECVSKAHVTGRDVSLPVKGALHHGRVSAVH